MLGLVGRADVVIRGDRDPDVWERAGVPRRRFGRVVGGVGTDVGEERLWAFADLPDPV